MAITHFFSRSEETLRRDKAEKERENWRKTLELKCDKLMEDNREMKELLKRIVTHTSSVPKIENTFT